MNSTRYFYEKYPSFFSYSILFPIAHYELGVASFLNLSRRVMVVWRRCLLMQHAIDSNLMKIFTFTMIVPSQELHSEAIGSNLQGTPQNCLYESDSCCSTAIS